MPSRARLDVFSSGRGVDDQLSEDGVGDATLEAAKGFRADGAGCSVGVAGPGSGWSEVPVSGCEPAALDS